MTLTGNLLENANAAGTEDTRTVLATSEDRHLLLEIRFLEGAANIVRANAQASVTTYVNVNNHYEGSAPLTIEKLLKLL
jgi:uncharacterized protein YecE (DUF72 family)